ELGVDFVTLSPVLPTQSHPDAAHLGWERARELIDSVNMPVYLWGGRGPQQLSQALEAGAQGGAGARQVWGVGGEWGVGELVLVRPRVAPARVGVARVRCAPGVHAAWERRAHGPRSDSMSQLSSGVAL